MAIKKFKTFFNDRFMYIITGIYMMSLLTGNVIYYVSEPNFEFIIKTVRYICYVFFTLNIVKDWKNGAPVTVGMILFATLSACVAIFSKNKDILLLFLFTYAVRNLKFNEIVRNTLKIYMITFFAIVCLSLLGVIPDWTFSRGNIIRHSLGFYYSTITIGIYLSIILMYFYINKSKASYVEILALETINVFLYIYTDGRLSFILITMLLFIMAISKIDLVKKTFKKENIQSALKWLCYGLPSILLILIIVGTYLYSIGNPIGIYINKLLSGRLLYTKNAFLEYGVTPFGQPIKWDGWGGFGYADINIVNFKYNFVDISYARILFDYGIIPSIFILVIYNIALVKNFKEKKYWSIITLFCILIWSTIEPYIFSVGKNIFILSFVSIYDLGRKNILQYENIKFKLRGRN